MSNKKVPLSLRRRAVLALPWVSEIKNPERCTALKGGAPLKALRKRDKTRQDDPVILDKWRCTLKGKYRYRFLRSNNFRPDNAKSYCWSHLLYRGFDMLEHERAVRWWRRHGWLDDQGRLIDPEGS